MRITNISTAVVEGNFDWTYVRIETDDGVTGIGECFFAPGLVAVIQEFATILIGEDPFAIDRLYQRMRWATSHAGDAGVAFHAISGIDAALWDLKGRALGVPIYELLGGKFRDRVRIYVDCHAGHALEGLGPLLQRRTPRWIAEVDEPADAGRSYYDDLEDESESFTPDGYAAKALEMKERGFTVMKFDLDVPVAGTTPPDPFTRALTAAQLDALAELVHHTCAAVGGHVDVAFDCHWRLPARDALLLARRLEDAPIAWLEDPTPVENPAALARVAHRTTTPIGTGENWFTREGFREALALGAIDVALPDFQKCGGLGEAKRIAELVDLHHLSISPHNISSPIGTLASVHLAAALPNFHSLEFHSDEVPFWNEIAAGTRPLIEDGHIQVPDGPGLGIDLDLDVAARHAKPGERFFE